MPEPLLFLPHRIPFPPNKGDKIRSFHLLQYLSSRYTVHLGTFVDDKADWQYADSVKKLCGECCLIPMNPRTSRLRSLTGLLTGEALTLPYYRNATLQAWVNATIQNYGIKKVVAFSSSMAQYVEHQSHAHRIMDFVDVDSDKWMQYAQTKRWPLSGIYRREGRLLLKYERQVAQDFNASFFVSAEEASLFKSMAPESKGRVHWFSNGVDAEYFSPHGAYPNPYPPDQQILVFTGAMDYWPNIDAVIWFAREIFPQILAKNPQVRFYIVGSNPAQPVLALAQMAGVLVTGRVADVRPYLAHAQLAVAPLRIARGIQNKVLEALAMAKTVVATPQAMEGLDAGLGAGCMIGSTPAEFVECIIPQVCSGPQANPSGREWVLQHYDWTQNLLKMEWQLSPENMR
jgi:sugar transferase (PEP-CTERM/EpsH1 system associated)